MALWLELRPANDVDWRRFEDDEASLVAAEERARAMIQCKVVTPDGVRIVWSPGVQPRLPRRIGTRELADLALIGGKRG